MPEPQLSLFGNAAPTVQRLPAALVRDELKALATQLDPRMRFGTMSWGFLGWVGLVYGEGVRERDLSSRGLTAYAQHPLLRAVEIDRTFYSPIERQAYEAYAAQVPADFRFVGKAHDACTTVRFPDHPRYGANKGQRNPLLFDVGYATDVVIKPFVEGLGDKAGPLVFQFPPQEVRYPERFAEKLFAFLSALPKGPTYAVEIRNRELLTQMYGDALVGAGAMHCYNAWSKMPSVLVQRELLPKETRKVLVARWLLRPGDDYESALARYHPFAKLGEEDVERRLELVRLIREAEDPEGVYFLVNNKAEGCAPESIVRVVQELLLRGDEAGPAECQPTPTT